MSDHSGLRGFRWLGYVARHFGWVMRHPLNRDRPFATLGRYLGWHLGSRMLGHPMVVPFVNDLRVVASTGAGSAVGVVHYGLEEYTDMAFCAHLLRPGDVFVDVGASIGTYTLLASGVAGADALAFEPVPDTARRLSDNVVLNRLDARVQIRRTAVGASAGSARMTTSLRAANHIAISDRGSTVEVPVTTLDAELAGVHPTMLKIDVEGFEQEVLDGANTVLRRDSLVAVLLEDVGLSARYRQGSGQHERMLALGFRSHLYCPEQRKLLDLQNLRNTDGGNTLYLRNLPFVNERLASAAKFNVRGRSI